jgi:hypothetical protein
VQHFCNLPYFQIFLLIYLTWVQIRFHLADNNLMLPQLVYSCSIIVIYYSLSILLLPLSCCLYYLKYILSDISSSDSCNKCQLMMGRLCFRQTWKLWGQNLLLKVRQQYPVCRLCPRCSPRIALTFSWGVLASNQCHPPKHHHQMKVSFRNN